MKLKELILIGLVLPVIAIVIGLFIEYRSGLFHPTTSKGITPGLLWLLLIGVVVVLPPVFSKRVRSFYKRFWRTYRRLLDWWWKQRRYILLAVLFICLEGTLYWLAGLKLVALSVAHLALVTLAIKLFVPKRPMVASSLDAISGLVERIDFDYLPELPTSKRGGWVLFTQGEPPKFGTVNYLGEKALEIQKVDYYALDYDVKTDAGRRGETVEYVARFKSEGVVYAHINVQSKDHPSEEVWIQFRVGKGRSAKEHTDNEWVLHITPTDEFTGNWQLFREDLIAATRETFGEKEKSFEGLIGFRLRGNLELAYIAVFE